MLRSYFYLLRPYQWVKNLLVFSPLIFSQNLSDRSFFMNTLIVFAAFCLVSSSVYIFNDVLDLEADKKHPIKKLRPLPAGKVQIPGATTLGIVLLFSGLFLGFGVSYNSGWILCIYVILNVVYSLYLKHTEILDVMLIAAFFILRIFAGASAINVEVSYWLVICVAQLALFLGFNKRRHELRLLKRVSGTHRRVLTSYSAYFIDQMVAVITASTVVFYTLYTIDERTVQIFGTNHLLYTLPFVYYGIFRYLYLVHKSGKGGDPARLLIADRKMLINLVLWIATCLLVIYAKL